MTDSEFLEQQRRNTQPMPRRPRRSPIDWMLSSPVAFLFGVALFPLWPILAFVMMVWWFLDESKRHYATGEPFGSGTAPMIPRWPGEGVYDRAVLLDRAIQRDRGFQNSPNT